MRPLTIFCQFHQMSARHRLYFLLYIRKYPVTDLITRVFFFSIGGILSPTVPVSPDYLLNLLSIQTQ